MKTGIILYHKNIYSIYERRWVDMCINSLRGQTYKNYAVYELCYSDSPEQIWMGSDYEHKPLDNHIFAMNDIIDRAFGDGCDVVANVNLDDYFSPDRLECQLSAIKDGYQLVSSNFVHIDGGDQAIREMIFHDKSIGGELSVNHNIICHSSVMITRGFWQRNKYYQTGELGYEDMNLWKKAVGNGEKMIVLPQILCYYRIHGNQTGRINPCK